MKVILDLSNHDIREYQKSEFVEVIPLYQIGRYYWKVLAKDEVRILHVSTNKDISLINKQIFTFEEDGDLILTQFIFTQDGVLPSLQGTGKKIIFTLV